MINLGLAISKILILVILYDEMFQNRNFEHFGIFLLIFVFDENPRIFLLIFPPSGRMNGHAHVYVLVIYKTRCK